MATPTSIEVTNELSRSGTPASSMWRANISWIHLFVMYALWQTTVDLLRGGSTFVPILVVFVYLAGGVFWRAQIGRAGWLLSFAVAIAIAFFCNAITSRAARAVPAPPMIREQRRVDIATSKSLRYKVGAAPTPLLLIKPRPLVARRHEQT